MTYFHERRMELLGERARKPKFNARNTMIQYARQVEQRKTQEGRETAVRRLERYWNAQAGC